MHFDVRTQKSVKTRIKNQISHSRTQSHLANNFFFYKNLLFHNSSIFEPTEKKCRFRKLENNQVSHNRFFDYPFGLRVRAFFLNEPKGDFLIIVISLLFELFLENPFEVNVVHISPLFIILTELQKDCNFFKLNF